LSLQTQPSLRDSTLIARPFPALKRPGYDQSSLRDLRETANCKLFLQFQLQWNKLFFGFADLLE
jgi:hypothetical protein